MNIGKISSKEIFEYKGIAGTIQPIGSEVRYNHTNCPAGTDTRKRLYIRKTADGYLAYCHNCGRGGIASFERDPKTNTTPQGPHVAMSGDRNGLDELCVLTDKDKALAYYSLKKSFDTHRPLFDCSNCPTLIGKAFPEFDPAWVPKYQVVAIDSHLATGLLVELILPAAFDESGSPKIYSVKRKTLDFNDKVEVATPKWLHFSLTGKMPPILDNPDTKRCVIVEDRISAIKVVEATEGEVTACTLSGTNVSDEDLFKLSMLYDEFMVWLDNDSGAVIAKASDIRRRLKMYKKDSAVTGTELLDPKTNSLDQIRFRIELAFD